MRTMKPFSRVLFVITINLLVVSFLSYRNHIKADPLNQNSQYLSTPELLDIAVANGEITEEERLLYLAYSLFEASSLPTQFRSPTLISGTPYAIEVSDAWNNVQSGFVSGFSPAVHSELERLLLGPDDFCSIPDSSIPPITSGDFWVMYEPPTELGIWDYLNALNDAYDFYIIDNGWIAPPLCDVTNSINCRHTNTNGYPIRITHDSNYAGYVWPYIDLGKYNGTVGHFHNPTTPSAFASCMVLNANLAQDPNASAEDWVKVTAVHEFLHMIQFGLDGINDPEDPMWYESGADYMEHVLYPNININYEHLWPEVDQCLGEYPEIDERQYTNWLFFQYASEHYGGQDVMQEFWLNVTAGQEGLAAYNNALLDVGSVTLQDLFHEYAVATRYPITCSSNYCYQNAADYLAYAGPLSAHHTLSTVGPVTIIGQIRDNFAAQWIDLPVEDLPYKVYINNPSQDGILRASIVEKIPSGIRIRPASHLIGPNTVWVWDFDPDDNATGVTLVLTNQESDLNNMPDPEACELDDYRVTVSRETTAVTLAWWDVAAQGNEQIKLSWQTVWEGNSEAFQIFRSNTPEVSGSVLVHEQPATNNPMGHYYEWVDTGVQNDTVYYYWLREVDYSGVTETWGPETGITGLPATIQFTANNHPSSIGIPPKTNFTLAWDSSLAVNCYATGRWSGDVLTTGSRLIRGFEQGTRTYNLNCVNQYGVVSRSSVSVTICTGVYCNPEQ